MITFEPPPATDVGRELPKPALTRFVKRAREAAGLPGEVDVLLADDATLKRLNRTYRGKNKPTDVLSFPSPDEFAQLTAGDLAISLETAARQAAEHGHSLREEVSILLLHGMLHLAGYDHETDAGEMAGREAELRRALKLPESLTERTRERTAPARPASRSTKGAPRRTSSAARSRSTRGAGRATKKAASSCASAARRRGKQP